MIDYAKIGLIPSYNEFPVESVTVDGVKYDIPSEDILSQNGIIYGGAGYTYSKNTRNSTYTIKLVNNDLSDIDYLDCMVELIGYDSTGTGAETERHCLHTTKRVIGDTNVNIAGSQKLSSSTYNVVVNFILYDADTGKRHSEIFTRQIKLK